MPNQTQSNSEKKSGYKKSKIFRMVTAGLIAFLLWFFVISVERTETERTFTNVEVRFVGYSPAEDVDILKDRGLKIVSETEDLTVDLRLHGRRSVLNSLRSSDMYVEVNLQSIYETGPRELQYEIKYPGDVDSSGIEVISRIPDGITVKVVSWVEKNIDLHKPEIIGEPAEGYRLSDTITQSNDTIKIGGPKEVIDRIEYAKVVLDVAGITESQEIRQGFVYYDRDGNEVTDIDSVKATPDSTSVTVTVLKEKDVSLSMPVFIDEDAADTEFTLNTIITMTNGIQNSFENVIMYEDGIITLDGVVQTPDENGKISIGLDQITVFGPQYPTDYVTDVKLETLDLADMIAGNVLELTAEDIDLRQDGVDCDVENVAITMTKREKATQLIGGVTIQNPKDYKLGQSSLSVVVKGFPEDLEVVTSGNIVAIFEEEVTESGKYPISVSVSGHDGVVVVGEYFVDVTVYTRPVVDELVNPELPSQST